MWGWRAAMSLFAKLKRGWGPLVESSTHISRAPGTKQGCKKSASRWGRLIALEGLGTSWEQRICSTAHRSQAGHCAPPSCAEKTLLLLVWSGEVANTTLNVWSRLQQAVALVGQVCQQCLSCLPWQIPARLISWTWGCGVREGSWSPARPGAEEISKGNQLQHATARWLPALCLALLCISIGLSELIRWMTSTICQAILQSLSHPALVWRCWRLFPGACCNPACCCFVKSSS